MKKILKLIISTLKIFKKIICYLYNRVPYCWASFLCIIYPIPIIRINQGVEYVILVAFCATMFAASAVFLSILIEDKFNLRIKFKIIENSKIYKSIMTILLLPFYVLFLTPFVVFIFSSATFLIHQISSVM